MLCAPNMGNETMAMLGQDLERPAGETAWTVIDANLRGVEPAPSDMAVVVAFFG